MLLSFSSFAQRNLQTPLSFPVGEASARSPEFRAHQYRQCSETQQGRPIDDAEWKRTDLIVAQRIWRAIISRRTEICGETGQADSLTCSAVPHLETQEKTAAIIMRPLVSLRTRNSVCPSFR